MTSPKNNQSKAAHADKKPFLNGRGAIRRAIRAWFEGQGFTEVESGALVASPGNETHLDAFETRHAEGARPLYLHTSPEFACKKLLAAGETKIFDLARVYRRGEAGPLHAPEFTMLEWYRAHAPYTAVMDDCVSLARVAAQATGASALSFRGRNADLARDAEKISVAEAFYKFAGIDLLAALDDPPLLAEEARQMGVRVGADDTWSDIFSRVLVEKIEPHLGDGRLTILYDYPRGEAALSRAAADPRFGERFELYACGVELANGYGELTDPVEQRARLVSQMDERERRYGSRYPLDEDFLAALGEMPEASGCALGFDRLVMLATNARRIDDVLWTAAP